MNSESVLINSAGSIACGFFSIIMIFLLIGSPSGDLQKENYAVSKGPRPYKMDMTAKDSLNSNLKNQLNKKESLFSPIIIEAADKHDIDPALIKAIIMAESGYDPMATSKRGAVGLMQIMPQIATTHGTDEDMYNPVHNINAGVEYLKGLLNQFGGDLELTLAAYNAGSSKVLKYQGVPPYEATRHYVKKVFEYYRYYQGA
jgi:soluble lytic murein transglycosylase-like protein